MLIYKATNRINSKVYIGKWMGVSVQTRWNQHISAANKGSRWHLSYAIRKYGPRFFEVEVIDRAQTAEELSEKEKHYIALYQSNDPKKGYNMTSGGDGRPHTEVEKEQLSQRMLGNKRAAGCRHSDEWKETARQRMLGNQYAAGRKHRVRRKSITVSVATRAKMSRSHKQRMSTPEGRELARKMAQARWGAN
jgi:group I intron endonuclease